MLPFQLTIYPLSVLFEDAILLGVETDTVHYHHQTAAGHAPSKTGPAFRRLPYCVVERNSQVNLFNLLLDFWVVPRF